MPEDGVICAVCGAPVKSDFIYCPYCGQQTNFTSSNTGKVPIPLGVVLLAVTEIMVALVMLPGGIVKFAPFTIDISLLNIAVGILLFNGYSFARYLSILATFLLASLFFSITIDLLLVVILVIYLTRVEVTAYFRQRHVKLAELRKSTI